MTFWCSPNIYNIRDVKQKSIIRALSCCSADEFSQTSLVALLILRWLCHVLARLSFLTKFKTSVQKWPHCGIWP